MSSYTFRGVTLPDNLKESLDAYAHEGRPLGDFLRVCVQNDLSLAWGLADEVSTAALPAIVGYIYNEMPSECWGSREAYWLWLNKALRGAHEGEA